MLWRTHIAASKTLISNISHNIQYFKVYFRLWRTHIAASQTLISKISHNIQYFKIYFRLWRTHTAASKTFISYISHNIQYFKIYFRMWRTHIAASQTLIARRLRAADKGRDRPKDGFHLCKNFFHIFSFHPQKLFGFRAEYWHFSTY